LFPWLASEELALARSRSYLSMMSDDDDALCLLLLLLLGCWLGCVCDSVCVCAWLLAGCFCAAFCAWCVVIMIEIVGLVCPPLQTPFRTPADIKGRSDICGLKTKWPNLFCCKSNVTKAVSKQEISYLIKTNVLCNGEFKSH
jgi:hypothetical protein